MPWSRKIIKKCNDFLGLINNYLEPIYLLRVPIISGLFLFLFPIIANTFASSFLQNLFAMQDDWQLFFVMVASALTSILIISLSKTILAVYFEEKYDYQKIRLLLSIGIVIPTWISIYLNSYPKSYQEEDIQLISFISGLVISLSMFAVVALYDSRGKITIPEKVRDSLKISEKNLILIVFGQKKT